MLLHLIFSLFIHFVMYVVYGCKDFTHPFGREEKSKVKGLVRHENILRTLEYGLHCMPYSVMSC